MPSSRPRLLVAIRKMAVSRPAKAANRAIAWMPGSGLVTRKMTARSATKAPPNTTARSALGSCALDICRGDRDRGTAAEGRSGTPGDSDCGAGPGAAGRLPGPKEGSPGSGSAVGMLASSDGDKPSQGAVFSPLTSPDAGLSSASWLETTVSAPLSSSVQPDEECSKPSLPTAAPNPLGEVPPRPLPERARASISAAEAI